MNTDSRALSKLERKVQRAIVEALISTAVAKGEIDPTGKSQREMWEELLPTFKSLATGEQKMAWVIDPRSTLLAQARDFRKRERAELAILLYATWFEHWINGLLDNRAATAGFTAAEVSLLLRHTSTLKAKFSCFPVIVKFPRLSAKHIHAVATCAELRNAFVHYKFTARLMDD